MKVMNSYTKLPIADVNIPAQTLADNAMVLEYLKSQGFNLVRATVGSAKSIGIADKVVWVFPAPVAKPKNETQKPGSSSTPKTTQAQTPSRAPRTNKGDLTAQQKRVVTMTQKATGKSAAEVIRLLGF